MSAPNNLIFDGGVTKSHPLILMCDDKSCGRIFLTKESFDDHGHMSDQEETQAAKPCPKSKKKTSGFEVVTKKNIKPSGSTVYIVDRKESTQFTEKEKNCQGDSSMQER